VAIRHLRRPFATSWVNIDAFNGCIVQGAQLHGDRLIASSLDEVAGDYDVRACNIRSGQVTDVAQDNGASQDGYGKVFHDTFAWSQDSGIVWAPRYSNPMYPIVNWPFTGEDHWPGGMFGRRIVYERGAWQIDRDVVLATSSQKLRARTAGSNRYATAAAVSRGYFAAAENVVLCTGENFPDALAAAPLARALEGPLLLTRRSAVPAETVAELTRLGAKKVYLIGGTPTISSSVASTIDSLPGLSVERIAGANRYETSARVALKLREVMGDVFRPRAFFTRGDNFPDALAVGPVAGGACAPILLVQPTALPSSVRSAIDVLNINAGTVLGDTNSVSTSTKDAIDAALAANGGWFPTGRLGGANRYETARMIANYGIASGWVDLDTIGVAVGTKFPDALGGGAALGYYGSPLVLTAGTTVSPATNSFLAEHRYEIGRLDVFGDASSVSDSVMATILSKIE